MKNKVLSLLLSLLISFGLWLYVVTVISPEYEATVYGVPVEFVGSGYLDSKNMLVTSETNGIRTDLTLRGNRSDLKKFTNSNITAIVDLSQITHSGDYQLDYNVSFQTGSAEVVSKNPGSISVTVADKLTKTIPVDVTYVGNLPEGYEAENHAGIELDHATVTVSGPKKTIDRIASAGIVVDLTGRMTSFVQEYPITLCGIDGRPIADDSFVTANLENIRAVVQVYKVKTVPVQFQLDFVASGLQSDMVTIYPQQETVTLYGNAEDLAQVGDVLIFTISLSQYDQATTEIFVPELPGGVQCKEQIQAHIQMPDMMRRVLTISNYHLNKVPAGLTVVNAQESQIELRGPAEILGQLSVDEVRATVDCSSVAGGSAYAPVSYVVRGHEYLYIQSTRTYVLVYASPVE